MSSNGFLDVDLMCSNLDSYYASTDYGSPETPGATSQAGVYDCSNGAGAPSSNTRSDESRMPYSVADGTSSHSWVMRFHQEQPCNPALPGSVVLIGGSPRPENHSQNHAVVNGSASLSQRALSEDAYATEALISQKKSITISVYISEREGKSVDKEMANGHFFSRAEFIRHCVNRYTESNYGIKTFKCPADSPVNGSSFRSRFTLPKDACEAEAEKTKKRKTDTEPAGGKKRIPLNLAIRTPGELEVLDNIKSKGKYFSRSEFIKHCINLYWINKYGEKLINYRESEPAAELVKFPAFPETVHELKQKDEAAINKITTREEKIKAQEEKIKTQEEKIKAQEEKIKAQEEKIKAQEEKIKAQEDKITTLEKIISK